MHETGDGICFDLHINWDATDIDYSCFTFLGDCSNPDMCGCRISDVLQMLNIQECCQYINKPHMADHRCRKKKDSISTIRILSLLFYIIFHSFCLFAEVRLCD